VGCMYVGAAVGCMYVGAREEEEVEEGLYLRSETRKRVLIMCKGGM
jgi:hypothetical protein